MIKLLSAMLNTVITILLLGATSLRCVGGGDIKPEILNYIKKQSGYTEISFATKPIPFNISSTAENILSEKYIKGFSYNKGAIVQEEQSTVTKVEDSLKALSLKLNNLCIQKYSESLPQIKKENNSYILFLTPVCSGIVYAELINSASIIVSNNQYEFFGEAKTFVFLIDDNTIKQVYTGSIVYN
ncbi:MAG: hypothetical protein WDO19_23980 [Bacteroidota bacterium]